MTFLAFKGQIFFTKIFIFVNVGLRVNLIILLPLVSELWRRSKIAPKAQCGGYSTVKLLGFTYKKANSFRLGPSWNFQIEMRIFQMFPYRCMLRGRFFYRLCFYWKKPFRNRLKWRRWQQLNDKKKMCFLRKWYVWLDLHKIFFLEENVFLGH